MAPGEVVEHHPKRRALTIANEDIIMQTSTVAFKLARRYEAEHGPANAEEAREEIKERIAQGHLPFDYLDDPCDDADDWDIPF